MSCSLALNGMQPDELRQAGCALLEVAPAHLARAVALRSRGGGSSGDESEAPVAEQCDDDQPMRAHNAFRIGGGSPARGRKVLR